MCIFRLVLCDNSAFFNCKYPYIKYILCHIYLTIVLLFLLLQVLFLLPLTSQLLSNLLNSCFCFFPSYSPKHFSFNIRRGGNVQSSRIQKRKRKTKKKNKTHRNLSKYYCHRNLRRLHRKNEQLLVLVITIS